MNVLHLWGDYSPDLFDHSHRLCLDEGHESKIICRTFIENESPSLPSTYAVRHRLPIETNSAGILSRLIRFIRRPIDSYRFGLLVSRHVELNRPDVIHVHFGTTAAELIKWRRLPSLPLIVSFYGVDASASLRDPSILDCYKELFRRKALIHVLCQEVADRLISVECPREQIVIANLPANIENMPNIGVSKNSDTRFLIPARFVEKKGHVVLLEAFETLLRSYPGATLTCFGYGPTDWLRKLVDRSGHSKSISIIDNGQTGAFLEHYHQMLRTHDIVLAPSIKASTGDDEGGPALTLVMAQAAGKPVIVSDFPGSERSVNHGVEGLVVPCGDARALYIAMSSLYAQPDRWAELGLAGRVRVLNDFSVSKYWRHLSEWYERAIATE